VLQLGFLLATFPLFFFLIGVVGGGVQLGPLGTAAINRAIVPAPGDYDGGEIGGMMMGTGNRSTRSAALSTTSPTCCPDENPGRRGGKPATNRLSYGTANVLSKPGMQMRKQWCLLSDNWVGLGNAGSEEGQRFSKKVRNRC
jgi:hypothetical protein